MKIKRLLTTALAVTALCAISTGVGLFSASGETAAYEGFGIDGASIRDSAPVGLRFETSVPEQIKDDYTFGTIIIPATVLGDAELLKTTDKVLDIRAEKWASGENRFFAVLVGNGLTDFPESKYNEQIVARSYAQNAAGEAVYYTDAVTRSVAKVASEALCKGGFTEENKPFLTDIVDDVIGEELKFDSSAVKIEKNTDYNLYDLFKTNNGNKGLSVLWEITEGSELCELSGDSLTVTGDGIITVKAAIGSKSATVVINDVLPATPQNLTFDLKTATIGWDVCENAASYDVKVTCWNSGETVYEGNVFGTFAKISETELCGVYTAEVSAKTAHGTSGKKAVLKDKASYDNPDFNVYDETSGRTTLFKFTDGAVANLVKESEWSYGKNESNPLKENSLTVSSGELSFTGTGECSGVAFKFNAPVKTSDISSLYANIFIENGKWYFMMVISDGVNTAYKTLFASNSAGDYTGKYYNYSVKISEFTATDGGAMLSEVSEMMIVTYQQGYNIKVKELSYSSLPKLPKGFNEQSVDGSYTLADFSNAEYKNYLTTTGMSYAVTETGISATFPGDWNAYITYNLPETIALSDIDKITVNCKIQGNDTDYVGFYLVDSAASGSAKGVYVKNDKSYFTFSNNKFTINVAAMIAAGVISDDLVAIRFSGAAYKPTNTYLSITYTKNA